MFEYFGGPLDGLVVSYVPPIQSQINLEFYRHEFAPEFAYDVWRPSSEQTGVVTTYRRTGTRLHHVKTEGV